MANRPPLTSSPSRFRQSSTVSPRFDELPEVVPGVPATRMFLGPGVLIHAVAVYGVLTDDDVIELIGIATEV